MDQTRYRLLYAGLALALLAVIVLAVAFGSPEGRDIGLPDPVESVSPLPGETVMRQARIEVDLPVGVELALFVDGVRVPESEIEVVEATGVHTWEPAPGQVITTWTPGPHTVRISWQSATGAVDPGQFEWSFRVS